tara:strand:- start:696 stop:797 length:102 start_codon:yes stop_codon:yes gene_type:complete
MGPKTPNIAPTIDNQKGAVIIKKTIAANSTMKT